MIRDLITKLKRDENERQKSAASAGKPLHWFSCGPTTKTPSTAAVATSCRRRSVTTLPSQDFTTHISNDNDDDAVGGRGAEKGVRTTVTTWKPSWSAYCGEPLLEAGVAEPLFWKIIRRALSHISQSLSLCLVVVSFLNSWLSSARRQFGFKRAPAVGCGNTKGAAQERKLTESSSTFLSNLQPLKWKENFHSGDCCCGVVETSKKKKKKRKVFNSSYGTKKGVLSEWTRVGGEEGRNKVTRQERLFCKAAWSRSSHTHFSHTSTHLLTHTLTHRNRNTLSLFHTLTLTDSLEHTHTHTHTHIHTHYHREEEGERVSVSVCECVCK